jgi:hypothetical protein
MGLKNAIKTNFKTTNRIQDDDVNHKGKYFLRERKLLFLIKFSTYFLIGLLKIQVLELFGFKI